MSQSYIFSDTNHGNVDIPCRYSRSFNEPLITNIQSKNLSITRLTVPTSNIELLNFDNRADYTLGFLGYNPLTSPKYDYYTATMPNQSSHDILYRSNERILEMVNRTLLKSYSNYMKTFGTGT